MNTIGDRIRLRRKELSLTQAALGKAIGISGPAISQLEKGESKSPSSENLLALAKALLCDPQWLQTGEMSDLGLGLAQPPRVRNYDIPVLDVELSAGFGAENHSEMVVDTLPVPEPLLDQFGVQPDSARIVSVRGDSMESTLHSGDKIIVNTAERQPMGNNIYAFEFDGEMKVKRFIKNYDNSWTIRSDNTHDPAYTDQTVSAHNIAQLRIVGRVAGVLARKL